MKEESHQITVEEAQILGNAFKEKMAAFYRLAEHIATLSSGALALSVTFAKGGIDKSPCSLWCLRGAWFGFILAAAGFVLIHLARIASYDTVLDRVRKGLGLPPTVAPRWYFYIGRHLLIWGFLCGLFLLALYGVFQK
jgi:hypothetical protein